MGEQVETLADLLRSGLRAVCVGFNPPPISVKLGHYYQGSVGRAFYDRLRIAGILPSEVDSWEDDYLYANGVGFTDIVKRPSWRANEIPDTEYDHGRPILAEKLARTSPELVIFSLERAAPKYFQRTVGRGFIGQSISSSRVFVMPWKTQVDEALAELATWWGRCS